MDEYPSNQSRTDDTRDVRTGQGELPQGDPVREPRNSATADEAIPLRQPQDPVNAVNLSARPSDYTIREIDTGQTPLDEGMDELIDPAFNERLSTNPDVLDLSPDYIVEGEEPAFNEDPGTTDVIEVVEEGETYFAPTDPPSVRRRLDNAEVLGGFSGSSMEEPDMPEDQAARFAGGDEELAERVRYALARFVHHDLNIDVEVEYGIVYLHGSVGSLEDIEMAEQVAGSVPGVDDVEEDLEISIRWTTSEYRATIGRRNPRRRGSRPPYAHNGLGRALHPGRLAKAASELGLTVIALADHDRVDNVIPLQKEAAKYGIYVIPAVEASCQWDGTVYHMLVYNVNVNDTRFTGPFDDAKKHYAKIIAKGLEQLA